MFDNPATTTRIISSCLSVTLCGACGVLYAAGVDTPWNGWLYIIVAIVLCGVLAKNVAERLYPDAAAQSQDEMYEETDKMAEVFGYRLSLFAMLGAGLGVSTDRIDYQLAFFIVMLPLLFGPAMWWSIAALRGQVG